MFKGKEKVRVPKHVIHVEKLDMFPKTVGIASQRVLDLHPLARAQAQKAHPPVREPKVQRDLQRGKANRPKEKVKARWDPSLESSTQLRAKRKLNSGLKSLKQKARRLGMKKRGQTKMANGMNKLVSKVPSVLPVLIQHSKHPGRGHSPSTRRRWKENRRSSCWERFGSALKCFGTCHSGWFAIKAATMVSFTVGTSAARTKALPLHLNSINIFVQRLALMDIQTKSKSMLGRRTPMWCQKDAGTMDFGIQRLATC
jgi:hypothetical protein